MPKRKRMFIVMGLASILLSLIGCSSIQSKNDTESLVKFSTLSQEEKRDYVNEYLVVQYGGEYSISEILQPQKNPFKNETYYTALVTDNVGNKFNIWINKDGVVTDSSFVAKFEDRITAVFSDLISEKYSESQISTHTYLAMLPNKSWDESDDAMEMLKVESTSTDVKMIISNSDSISNEEASQLANKMTFCNGELIIFVVDDITKVDIDNLKRSDAIYTIKFNKED